MSVIPRKCPGAISAQGVPEYSYNLHLAKKIPPNCRQPGYHKGALLITAWTHMPRCWGVSRCITPRIIPLICFSRSHHDAAPDKFVENGPTKGQSISTLPLIVYAYRFKATLSSSPKNKQRYRENLHSRASSMQLKSTGAIPPHYLGKFMGNKPATPAGRSRRRRLNVSEQTFVVLIRRKGPPFCLNIAPSQSLRRA